MIFELAIFLVILVLIGAILFKILKTLIKAIFIEVILVGLLLILLGIVFFIDLSDFRQNFVTSEKLFMFDDNGELSTGFVVTTFTNPDALEAVPNDQLEYFNNRYQAKDMRAIKGDYYKVIILKKDAFNYIDDNVALGNQNFSKEFIFEILAADDGVEFLVKKQLPPETPEVLKQDYRDTLGNPDMLKARLLAVLFTQGMIQQGPVFLFWQFKDKNIIIYPESPIFKAVKFVPKSIARKLSVIDIT